MDIKNKNDQFPGSILKHVNRLMNKQENHLLESLKLHSSQTKLLLYIMQHKGCSQKKIANQLGVTAATTAQTVKVLELNGWIRRIQDEKDKRLMRIYTTKKSDELLAEAIDMHTRVYENGLIGFSEKERANLEEYLYRIADNLRRTNNEMKGE